MVMRGGIWPVEVEGSAPSGRRNRASACDSSRRDCSTASGSRCVPDVMSSMRDTFTAQPVAVVSESFAARHWPGKDPLGRRFKVAFKERTIVGVVGNVRVRGLERDSEPQVYLPNQQIDDGWMPFYAPKDLVIRASTPGDQLVPAVRADHSQRRSAAAGFGRASHGRHRRRGDRLTLGAGHGCSPGSPWSHSCSRQSASTAYSRSPCRSGPPRSASEWRSVRSAATSCAW